MKISRTCTALFVSFLSQADTHKHLYKYIFRYFVFSGVTGEVQWTDGFQPHLEDLEGETEHGGRPRPPPSLIF